MKGKKRKKKDNQEQCWHLYQLPQFLVERKRKLPLNFVAIWHSFPKEKGKRKSWFNRNNMVSQYQNNEDILRIKARRGGEERGINEFLRIDCGKNELQLFLRKISKSKDSTRASISSHGHRRIGSIRLIMIIWTPYYPVITNQ